ncbi:chromate efflux transporter [Corynebacterium sp.]|uniref:chromate efflux transporter n=1 Tax=Corynebacterium sp. TaxID=1720 RepID=UPI0028A7F6D1|nr:chromate efflux transporter [Corynebacterium sp.]
MADTPAPEPTTSSHKGTAWEVFWIFLKLGLTSFGGPIAHLGYFRTETVQRRGWLKDEEYADLVALCQFLPGPASSQVGFALGMHRAGFLGALAAFVAFTLPSAALLVLFAFGISLFDSPSAQGLLTGLKVVAVAIVAQAVLGMAKNLTPDKTRASIAVIAAGCALLLPGSAGQVIAIIFGLFAGYFFCGSDTTNTGGNLNLPVPRIVGIMSLVLFAVLLFGLPLLLAITGSSEVALFDSFYRAGALVFGGGHVVLPLLHNGVVETGWINEQDFLAGYGIAQAVPGPLFTFAAFLGTITTIGPNGVLGATIALIAIFLPGFLLLIGVLPFWNSFRQRAWAQAAMRGANAAVVGILGAALYTPVFTSTITGPGAFTLALACFVLLTVWKLPPWLVVVVGALGGLALSLI